MDFEEMLPSYQALLAENKALKEENLSLKLRLGLVELLESRPSPDQTQHNVSPEGASSPFNVNADPAEKIRLFMSLFKGRDDVYAKRWESKDGARSGYSPACRNEWERSLCRKPRIKCASCEHRSYAPLDENAWTLKKADPFLLNITDPCGAQYLGFFPSAFGCRFSLII